MPNIVTVNVTQTLAPTPSTLQRMGAFISQGATTLAVGTYSLLVQASSITSLLIGTKAITTITWTGGIATLTAAAAHGFTIGDTLLVTITGSTPVGYNGTYMATVTTTTAFTYPLATNPGTLTIAGVYTVADVAELVEMNTTFWGQGSNAAVYVLELGPGNATDGATYFTSWLTAHPGVFYIYLLPREWDANAAFLALIASYENTNSKTYFITTTTLGTYASYTPLMKDVLTLIEAPTVVAAGTELTAAAMMQIILNYNPSSLNKVPPLAFTYAYGVTPYPTLGNAALLTTLAAANVTVIGTGAEGGITNAIVTYGNTMDGNPFNYWYSVDWMQINADRNISNAVINGSNNPINPLYLNQDGINRLQQVLVSTVNSAMTFGLALGQVIQTELNATDFATALNLGTYAGQAVVNAVPFTAYYRANPSHYQAGIYNGFSITYTPLRGFLSITININVTTFVA